MDRADIDGADMDRADIADMDRADIDGADIGKRGQHRGVLSDNIPRVWPEPISHD